MLATFVIGLREGLEAALIVGIIAAFLSQDGKARALRLMWLGVGIAVTLCLGIGVILAVLSSTLPQRQQEMLETLIGLVAVGMVTWMVLWMRKHSKDLKRDLGVAVGGALAEGTSIALVAMAFLAVVREGVETAVFLVAASQTAAGGSTFVGAGLGILVAVVLGYLIYRGGLRLNLSRFFRITGVVLVLVAGGVLMSSLYHAYEAGWILIGNRTWLDFSAFIQPGSVQEALLSGVLGIRAQLRGIEVLAWLLYVLPMLAVVLWPPRRAPARRTVASVLLGVGAVAAVAAIALALFVPTPAPPIGADFALAATGSAAASDAGSSGGSSGAASSSAGSTGQLHVGVASATGDRITVTLVGSVSAAGMPGPPTDVDDTVTLPVSGGVVVSGRRAALFAGPRLTVPVTGGEATITASQLADLNRGRYPVGLRATDGDAELTASWTVTIAPTLTVDTATGAVLSMSAQVDPAVVATQDDGSAHRVRLGESHLTAAEASVSGAAAAAADQQAAGNRADTLGTLLPWSLGVWGGLLLIFGALLLVRRPPNDSASAEPSAPPRAPASPKVPVEAQGGLFETTAQCAPEGRGPASDAVLARGGGGASRRRSAAPRGEPRIEESEY